MSLTFALAATASSFGLDPIWIYAIVLGSSMYLFSKFSRATAEYIDDLDHAKYGYRDD